MDYKLSEPVDVDDDRTADAVVENDDGAWLAEWDSEADEAIPFTDEGGDYVPAPQDWKERV